MGLFGTKQDNVICSECGKSVPPIRIVEGDICFDCKVTEARVNYALTSKKPIEHRHAEADAIISKQYFTPTKTVGKYLQIDEINHTFQVKKPKTVFQFSDILGFQLLENGQTTSNNNIGNAIVGGVLFGGVGAIVGAGVNKKTHTDITEYKINILLNNQIHSSVDINFLTLGKVKRTSLEFKNYQKSAHDILAELTRIQMLR